MQKRDRLILIGIVTLSIILRAVAAFLLGDEISILPGTHDQISYHTLALRVLNGYGFTFGENWWPATSAGSPTAHWSYLYTFLLVAVYKIFGPHPLAARLIQVIIVGTLQPLLTYAIARRLFGKSVGLVAAAWNALYPYFIYYSATLMTEPFYITAILGSLYLAIIIAGRKPDVDRELTTIGDIKLALVLGVALGIAVLLRQLYLLFIPFLFLWIWFARKKMKRSHGALLVSVSIAIVIFMILPFTIFNYIRFDSFVLLNTNAGYAFFWSNHPIHNTDFIPARENIKYVELIPPELRHLDEASLDRALLERGFQFILADPYRYLLLSIDRIPQFFTFWPLQESGITSNITRVSSFGLILPFILLGIGIWIKSLLNSSTGISKIVISPGFLLLLFSIVYTGIHLLSWALIRYRLPVDAVLIPFAAIGVIRLISYIEERIKLDRKLV